MARCVLSSLIIILLLSTQVYAKLYKINKGSHNAVNFVGDTFPRMEHLKFEAVFNESAIYQLDDADQGDINKLYGFSDCGSHHLRNSARFGWRWNRTIGKLEIHAYTHVDKDVNSEYMGIVELNKSYTYEIKISDDKYLFREAVTATTLRSWVIGWDLILAGQQTLLTTYISLPRK